MDGYLAVKLLHILSSTVLFGTGLGTAFFMLRAWQSKSDEAMRVTTAHVVQADWLFTTPAVVVQLATGLWLTSQIGISYLSLWFAVVITLFALVGACWLPVVWIQIHIRNLIGKGVEPSQYRRLMRWWMALGIPAFLAVLALFVLMVYKPWVGIMLFN
ncbi:MAG: DUF2269 domain-containing protein [Gammaproteobacteria bacterium]|nr:DUF2269 domain-containing protein [Gammaproteobacteria bacterium]